MSVLEATASPALDLATLHEIARQVAGSEARWRPHVVHDPAGRRPVRLVATETYEVWVIGWTRGQRVDLHDHGDAVGVLLVTEGVLDEWVYRDGQLQVRTVGAGAAVDLPAGLIHEVVAPELADASSIHVYSPPLTTMGFYDRGDGSNLRTDDVGNDPDRDGDPLGNDVTPEQLGAPEEPSAIASHLDAVRRCLNRVAPEDLAGAVSAGALVVDIRPEADRRADGELPGAVVVERIHLEWRLDPTSPDRLPQADGSRRVIVVCNEGYASSLAAATLRQLGLHDATDLAGGYRAWAALSPPR